MGDLPGVDQLLDGAGESSIGASGSTVWWLVEQVDPLHIQPATESSTVDRMWSGREFRPVSVAWSAAPGVATYREPLGLPGEQIFGPILSRLEPISDPGPTRPGGGAAPPLGRRHPTLISCWML